MEVNYQIVEIEIAQAKARLPELSNILLDAVDSGASVSFMMPFTLTDAMIYWQSILPAVADGRTILLVALIEDRAVGTVQLGLATPPNQPHRADVAKLLVHRQVRRRGIGRALMEHLESIALLQSRTLLSLDTLAGGVVEQFYVSLGYILVGTIPKYACLPHGLLGDTSIFYKQLIPKS